MPNHTHRLARTNFRRPVGLGSSGLELGAARPNPAGSFFAISTGTSSTESSISPWSPHVRKRAQTHASQYLLGVESVKASPEGGGFEAAASGLCGGWVEEGGD